MAHNDFRGYLALKSLAKDVFTWKTLKNLFNLDLRRIYSTKILKLTVLSSIGVENSRKIWTVCRANTSHWLMIVHGESQPSLTITIELARLPNPFSLVEHI